MSFIYFNLFRNPQDAYLKKPVVIIIYLYILCLQLFVCLCPKNVKMAEQIVSQFCVITPENLYGKSKLKKNPQKFEIKMADIQSNKLRLKWPTFRATS